MIKKLYELGYFDYKNYILDNLKALSLTANEAIILIKILDSYREKASFNVEELRNKVNIRRDLFDTALSNLLERKIYEIYLSYENGVAGEALSLDGFFNLVEDILKGNSSFDESEIHSIIMLVSKEISRVLSSSELDIIKSLVEDDRYVKDDFIVAIDNIKKAKRSVNIKSLSNELAKGKTTPKVKKETPSYVKDFIKSVK